jgi:hypothetical protein
MKLTTILLAAIIPFAIISCGDKEKSESKTEETSNKAGLEHILLKEKPTDPIKISELRTDHKAGENVTFSGQIIGAKEVLIDELAVMIMGDPTKMTTCNLLPGDGCETPWDVCCDDKDVIRGNIVTVQVLDESGKPVKTGLRGLSGIKEMSDVIVTGEIDKSSNEKNMVINATGIFVN